MSNAGVELVQNLGAHLADASNGINSRGDTVSKHTRILSDTSNPRLRLVATLLAQGKTKREIATLLDCSYSAVINYAAQPIVKQYVSDLLREAGGNEVKSFLGSQILGSLETLVEIRDNPSARASDRTAAANSILDRALGKPTQHIESTVSTIENATLEVADLTTRLKELDSKLAAAGVHVN